MPNRFMKILPPSQQKIRPVIIEQFHRIVPSEELSYNIIMKRWTVVFRALANINRLKIIKMLADGHKMNVGDIAEDLNISFKATSNHLAMLKNLDVLEAQGAEGHVFYSINPQMPKDFQKIIEIILK